MLEAFGKFVVKSKLFIILFSIILVFPALIGMMRTPINYDIFAYLPENLPSVQGQNIMNKTFGYGGTGILMVKNKTDVEVENLKEKIEKVDGVETVNWITDLADLTLPREFLPEDLVNQFYANDSTMMQIQFQQEAASEKTYHSVQEIKKILGPNVYFAGTPPMLTELRQLLESEMFVYSASGIGFILVLLGLTLPSFIIPILILFSIGVSIIYNLGFPYYVGSSMSYITAAIAGALQLGVTMDFSIFLVHRYEEERKNKEKNEAMIVAIKRTALAILTSSATAVAGFLAMVPMALGIGQDLGITMARGVIFSVLLILTLLPSLILVFDKWIQKVQHPVFIPSFQRLAQVVTRKYKVIFVVFLLLFIPAVIGLKNVNVIYDIDQLMPKSLDSIKNLDVIKKDFPSTDSAFLVMDQTLSDQDRITIKKQVENMDGIKKVISYDTFADPTIPSEFIPENLKTMFMRDNYIYMLVQMEYGSYDERTTQAIQQINNMIKPYEGHIYLTGQSVLQNDLTKTVQDDIKKVDLISIVAVLLIIALALRSIALPVILVGGIELAIYFNQGLDFYLGRSMPFIGSFAIGAIQLGSTINYAILLVTRYKEELENLSKVEAMYRALKASGKAILSSALALFAAVIGIYIFSDISLLRDLTFMIARGAIISLAVILILLPAVLLTLETFTSKLTLGWPKIKMEKQQKRTVESIDLAK
ncbi:MMPL family transporter [Tepidibacillus infernus]|uniref:efflux RND transporter permease subunit n=1 Tax=Tepidibacillus TaxID=1494427 RepID=UPI000A91BEE6|nr:MMPL family transporter [Tepidibacillus decaturensis]